MENLDTDIAPPATAIAATRLALGEDDAIGQGDHRTAGGRIASIQAVYERCGDSALDNARPAD
jgi:hypothetical protein